LHAQAEPLMCGALAIDEVSFGAQHPDVARDLNNLATLLQDTNRLAQAKPLLSRALSIPGDTFPPEHPVVVTVRENLTALL
jgi:hypothetical protein